MPLASPTHSATEPAPRGCRAERADTPGPTRSSRATRAAVSLARAVQASTPRDDGRRECSSRDSVDVRQCGPSRPERRTRLVTRHVLAGGSASGLDEFRIGRFRGGHSANAAVREVDRSASSLTSGRSSVSALALEWSASATLVRRACVSRRWTFRESGSACCSASDDGAPVRSSTTLFARASWALRARDPRTQLTGTEQPPAGRRNLGFQPARSSAESTMTRSLAQGDWWGRNVPATSNPRLLRRASGEDNGEGSTSASLLSRELTVRRPAPG